MMHVVMLTNSVAPDKLGGLERYVAELADQLAGAGARVTVVAKRATDAASLIESRENGVTIRRYDVPSKRTASFAVRYPIAVTAAVKDVLSGDPSAILHGHFPVPTLYPALRRYPYIYTLHAPVYKELLSERQGGYFLPKPAQRVAVASLRRAERLVVNRADTVLTLSEFMRSEARILDPGVTVRSRVIPGGIDTVGKFFPSDVDRPGWASMADPLVFAARRLVPRTGVQQLVEAFPTVLAKYPAAMLALAGDGAQRQAIEATVLHLGIQDRVRLLGRISDEELVRYYQCSDLVVTPTQELEGYGLSTAEALACGTPALVTPVGANPEVVRGLDSRLVAEGKSPSQLASAMLRIFGSDVPIGAGSSAVRASAHPQLSWERVRDTHMDVYAEHLWRSRNS